MGELTTDEKGSSVTDDLVEWLRAHLDEDERVAKVGLKAMGDPPGYPDYQTYTDDDTCAADDFIGHFSPARVLREVEAKRLILDEHSIIERKVGWIEVDEDGTRNDFEAMLPVCRTCVPKHAYFESREAVPTGPCRTVKLMALPLTDRTGYRSEWAPTTRDTRDAEPA